jgi:hypothetical protein
MRIPRQPPLNVAQQYLALRSNPICAGSGNLQRGRLTWEYEVQPTLLSRTYTVRITYRVDERPQIVVRRPNLIDLAHPRRLPHVYRQDPPLLCLYMTGKGDWTRKMRLDQTIVPWTALWLFFFEEWLASNEWKGGGEHPGDTNKPRLELEPGEQ